MKKRIVSILLCLVFSLVSVTGITAFAASKTSQDGLIATISADKTSYEAGEEIALTLSVQNTNDEALENVTTLITLPEGIEVAEGTALSDTFTIDAGETVSSTLTLTTPAASITETTGAVQGTVTEDADIEVESGTPKTAVYVWSFVGILLLAGLGYVAYKKKLINKTMSILLVGLLVLGTQATPLVADATAASHLVARSISISKTVLVDGAETEFFATVSYAITQEEAEDTENADADAGSSSTSGTTAGTDETTVEATVEIATSSSSFSSSSSSSGNTTTEAVDYVVLHFETNGGTEVGDIVLQEGEALGYYPSTYLSDCTFDLWYTDGAFTQAFDCSQAIEKDTTLYASFVAADENIVYYDYTSLYLEDQASSFEFTVYSENEITAANLSQYVQVSASSEIGDITSYNIAVSGDYYTITANGGYYAGVLYTVTFGTGVTLTAPAVSGYNLSAITELSFRIYKEEDTTVDLSDDIITINMSDLFTLNESNYTAVALKTDDLFDPDSFVGAIVYFADTTYADPDEDGVNDSYYVKVTELYDETPDNNTDYYYFVFEDAELQDIYDDANVYFEGEPATIQQTVDTDALAQQIKESDGVRQFTYLLAAALMESDTVYEMGDGSDVFADADDTQALLAMAFGTEAEEIPSAAESLKTMYTSTVYSDSVSGTMFSGNAAVDDYKASGVTIENVIEDLSVEVKFGVAENTNFEGVEDGWVGITVALEYELELGNNVKLKATVDISEYLNITLDGWSEKYWSTSAFGYVVDFDYATNIYTQTDLNFTILVCSATNEEDDAGDVTNPDDAANDAATDALESVYEDITDEISGIIADADSDTLVAQMLEMLEEDGDYITLIDQSIFECSFNAYICDINFYVDFVVKFEFAAGLSADFSYLSADQYGIYTHDYQGTKYISAYNNKLTGNGRYVFELTACGYLGAKVGIAGEASISLPALKTFGEIGFGVEVGVYADLYVYARYLIAKPETDGDVMQSLDGAVYFEMGIYLEMYLFARSELFEQEAEWVFLDYKWPLFSAGNQYVYLGLAYELNPAEDILIVLRGDYTSKADAFPTFYGNYLDITTGDTSVEALPASWFSGVDFSTPYITDGLLSTTSYDWGFVYRDSDAYEDLYDEYVAIYGEYQTMGDGDVYLQGTMDIYKTYSSSTNLFGSNDNYLGEFEFIWVSDDYEGSIDGLGEIYTATFQLQDEETGEIFELGTREVVGGRTVGAFDPYEAASDELKATYSLATGRIAVYNEELGSYYSESIWDYTWDVDPTNATVTGDCTFTLTTEKREEYVGYVYYDEATTSWVADYMVVEHGDVPVLDISDGGYTYFTSLGIYQSSAEASQFVTDTENITAVYFDPDLAYDAYWTDLSETAYDESFETQWEALYYLRTGYYGVSDLFYVANYEFDTYTVTYVIDGTTDNAEIITEEVDYDSMPTGLNNGRTTDPYKLFIGWSDETGTDGKITIEGTEYGYIIGKDIDVDYAVEYGLLRTLSYGAYEARESSQYGYYMYDSDGGGNWYDWGDNEDTTLYAVYDSSMYTITVIDEDGTENTWEIPWGNNIPDEDNNGVNDVYDSMLEAAPSNGYQDTNQDGKDDTYYANASWILYLDSSKIDDYSVDDEIADVSTNLTPIETVLANIEASLFYWGDSNFVFSAYSETYHEMTVSAGDGSFDADAVQTVLTESMSSAEYYYPDGVADAYDETSGTITLFVQDNWYMEPNNFFGTLTAPSGIDGLTYSYQFSHWVDQDGTEYLLGDTFPAASKNYAFTAVFDQTEIEYTVDVYAYVMTVATADTESYAVENTLVESFAGNYEAYQAFVAQYTSDYDETAADAYATSRYSADTDAWDAVAYDYVYTDYDTIYFTLTDEDETEIITKITLNWTRADQQYTITYDANADETTSEDLTDPADATIQYGDTITAPSVADITDTTDGGYGSTFLGWDSDGDGTVDYEAGDTITVTADITLTAVWKHTCTITFNNAYGTAGQWFTDVVGEAFDNTQVEDPAAPANKVFTGWSVDPLPTEFTVNTTITPSFVFEDCTVTFELTVDGVVTTETVTAKYNDALADIIVTSDATEGATVLTTPTQADGKVWSGWGITNLSPTDFADYTITGDVTVTGIITTVYVTYMAGTNEYSKTEIAPGTVVTVADVVTGYGAWATTDATIESDGTFTMPEKNVTFTAVADLTGTFSISDGTNTDVFDAATYDASPDNGAVSGYAFADGVLWVNANGLTLSGEASNIIVIVSDAVTTLTLQDLTINNSETKQAIDGFPSWALNEANDDPANNYVIYAYGTDFTLSIDGDVSIMQTNAHSDGDQSVIYYIPLAWGEYQEEEYDEANDSWENVTKEGYIGTVGTFAIKGANDAVLTLYTNGSAGITSYAELTIDDVALNMTASVEGVEVKYGYDAEENKLGTPTLIITSCSITSAIGGGNPIALYADSDLTVTGCTFDAENDAVRSENGAVTFKGATGGTIGSIYCYTGLTLALDNDYVLTVTDGIVYRACGEIILTNTAASPSLASVDFSYGNEGEYNYGYVYELDGITHITNIVFTGTGS